MPERVFHRHEHSQQKTDVYNGKDIWIARVWKLCRLGKAIFPPKNDEASPTGQFTASNRACDMIYMCNVVIFG